MKEKIREMDAGRLEVIENIGRAVSEGDTFRKVEVHDLEPTEEDIRKVIVPFDNMRRGTLARLKGFLARKIAEHETIDRNTDTDIIGMEHLAGIEGGAVITCNHFNIMDNTIIRYLAMRCGRGADLDIMIQDRNVFMKGYFGFLMRNCNTMPVSSNLAYMARNLKPAIGQKLGQGRLVLIYPEQEMWFNYRKPRPLRDGAYHYAVESGVPILPCFVEMRELEGTDGQGFCRVRHILHVMPPIYPDCSLSPRETRKKMRDEDYRLKCECYERVYGIPLSDEFVPERDIAGYRGAR